MSRSRRALQAVRTVCRSVSLAGGRQNPIIQNLLTSRSGKPLKKHFSNHCEACLRGVCSAQTSDNAHGQHRRIFHRRRQSNATKIATPISAQSTADTTKVDKKEEKEAGTTSLHLEMPARCTMFGSGVGAIKRGEVFFRSLRCAENGEEKALKRDKSWKSCVDPVVTRNVE